MAYTPYVRDDARYMTYYMNQAGGELPGFIGSSTQYGNGLGGIFRGLLRMAVPLFKKGFSIAKPHLKNAAVNIVGDMASNIARSAVSRRQEGNGLMVIRKRPSKRPPSSRGRSSGRSKKRKTTVKVTRRIRKKSATKRSTTSKRRAVILRKDIF